MPRGVKRQRGGQNQRFLVIFVAIFPETSEWKPVLLRGVMKCHRLSGDPTMLDIE